MSGLQTNLLEGLAAYTAAGGIGATWSTSGAYTALQTGIVLGSVPQSPDRLITLSTYGVEDDATLSDSVLGVQVRSRWNGSDPRPAMDLDDDIFDLWQNVSQLLLSTGVWLVQLLRVSGPLPLGQDDAKRWSVSSNYYATVHAPSANRT